MVPLAKSWEGKEKQNICKYIAFEGPLSKTGASQMALEVKNPAAGDMRRGSNPWVRKILLEEERAIHSSILAWKIKWMEEPGGLQSTGLQRVGQDRAQSRMR